MKNIKKQTQGESTPGNFVVITEYVSSLERQLLEQKILLANTVADPNDQDSQDREMQKLRDLETQVSFQKLTNPNYAVKRLVMLPPEERKQKVKRPLDASQALLGLLLPKKNREGLLGDLAEEYQKILDSDGERTAKIWFYTQILTSLRPTLQNLIRTLIKCGFTAMVEEAIRRITR